MRDPKRIDLILARIREIWVQSPDLRLGQLILNAMPDDRTAYYVEDADLVRGLCDVYGPPASAKGTSR